MSTTKIINAQIVTMDDAGSIVSGDILIEDGKITAVGEVGSDVVADEIIDAEGQPVIPGFVQTHIHLCQTLMRNMADDMVLIDWLRTRIWPYEAALTADELKLSAEIGLAELFLSGTTTIVDMGTVRHTDALLETVVEKDMRAFAGKCMMDFGDEVPKPMQEVTADSLKESRRLHDTWNGQNNGRLQYAFCPRFAVSCTENLLREVAEMADDLGAFIHTHGSETTFENEFCDHHFGHSNVGFLEQVGVARDKTIMAHGVHVSDDDLAILKRTDTVIAHCPSSNLKLASGIANIPRYDEAGVRVSLGADGPPCNNNLDAFVEMRLAALIQKPIHGPTAMPAERVLKLATRDGAKAIGLDDEIGSIEVGKSADLVVLDFQNDPSMGPGGDVYSKIVYAAQRAHVRHVFAGGQQKVSNGILQSVDLGKLMSDGAAALDRIVDRM